jgi:CheY-like chemotaxis protein
MGTPHLPPHHDRPGGVRRAASAGAAAPESSGRPGQAGNWISVATARNVLIIDDNDRHLDLLHTILTSVGHDVETCGSGGEALQRLMARRYDVVVLDLVMPEVSGLTVAQQMRAGGLNVHTPVIACTADAPGARRLLADVDGIAAIICKPIDIMALILAVARAPRGRRRMDPARA